MKAHNGLNFPFFLCCILALTDLSALATTPYHAVTVSAIQYSENFSGDIIHVVINNHYILSHMLGGSPIGNLDQYALVINDNTGEVDVANKMTGPLPLNVFPNVAPQAPIIMNGTLINGIVGNLKNTTNYIDAAITFLGSVPGTAISIQKWDAIGNLLSDHISFNAIASGVFFTGTIVTTGKKYNF